MIQLKYIRMVTRSWFLLTLIAGAYLILFSMNTNAQSETQTQTGGPDIKRRPPSERVVDSSKPSAGDITIYLNPIIQERLEREGGQQWIHGRELEVQELNDTLVVSDDLKTVILDGEPKSGKTSIMEEFARLHPQDHIYSLNLDYLGELDQEVATKLLKEEIIRLKRTSAPANAGPRTILHIPNLSSLVRGLVHNPIDALWDQIGGRGNLYFVIESSATATDQIFKRMEIKELETRIPRLSVLPPTLESVIAYGLRLKNEIMAKKNISISTFAVEEAARLAMRKLGETKYLNLNSQGIYGRLRMLLSRSADVLARRQQTQTPGLIENKSRLSVLQKTQNALLADLKFDPQSEELNKRLSDIRARIEIATLAVANTSSPSSIHQQLANIELELLRAEKAVIDQQDQIRSRRSLLKPMATQEDSTRLKQLESEVARITNEKLRVEDEARTAIDTTERPAKQVGKDLILEVSAGWLKVPVAALTSNFSSGLQNMNNIKNVVFGQDHVVDAIRSRLVLRATHLQEGQSITSHEQADKVKSGLIDDFDRPLASMWFAGDTGVGKTETSLQLSETLGFSYRRFDMSEFQQEHYIARFIGSPQGYVGSNEDAELIQWLKSNPETVLVFDEIEKAHPKILTILLQLLDNGEVTSGDGKTKVSAKKAIVVMTSNLAQKLAGWDRKQLVTFLTEQGEGKPGWSIDKVKTETGMDILRLRSEVYKLYVTDPVHMRQEGLAPMRKEIFGRMDLVEMFNRLEPKTVMKITQKGVRNLKARLKYFYNIDIRLTPETMVNLAETFKDSEGARSMRRALDRMIRAPVAEMIVSQQLNPGDSLVVGFDEKNGLQIERGSASDLQVALAEDGQLRISSPAVDDMRARINARKRPVFTQTMELVRQVVDPDLLIGERGFARFRARRR